MNRALPKSTRPSEPEQFQQDLLLIDDWVFVALVDDVGASVVDGGGAVVVAIERA